MESLYHHSDFTAKEDAPPPEFPEKEISSTSELQPSLPFRTPFALINIAQGDRIRIVGFPATELPALESIIAGAWPRGIQDSRTYGGGHEIKLKGNPWVLAMTARQVVESRCFVVGLLRGFFERGWVIKAATGVNKNTLDLSTLSSPLIFTRYFVVKRRKTPLKAETADGVSQQPSSSGTRPQPRRRANGCASTSGPGTGCC